MAGFTDYLEEGLLNHIFGGTPFSQPTDIYVALLGSVPTDPTDDAGVAAAEITGTDYERQLVSAWTVSTDVSGLTSAINDNPISFPTVPAGGWGTVAGFGIYDTSAVQTGSLLMFGEFSFPISVGEGSTVTFQPGDLKINLA
jgi:hypothetical protein